MLGSEDDPSSIVGGAESEPSCVVCANGNDGGKCVVAADIAADRSVERNVAV